MLFPTLPLPKHPSMTAYQRIRVLPTFTMAAFMAAIYQPGWFPPIMRGGWLLLKQKARYLGLLALRESLVLLSTLAVISSNIPGMLALPLVITLLEKRFELWMCDLIWEIKADFREMANRHFQSLPYRDQKKVDDMESLQSKIDTAGGVMTSVMTWGIPTIVRAAIAIISTVIASVYYGFWWITPMGVIILGGFYKLYLSRQRQALTQVRENRKKAQDDEDIVRKFRLQQFQNRQRDECDIEELVRPRETFEREFARGWDSIAFDVTTVATVMTTIWLLPVADNIVLFLAAMNIYTQLRNAIVMVAHFGNQMAARVKDFDKYQQWYQKCSAPEERSIQKPFPSTGLCFSSVQLSFGDKFSLRTSTPLEVRPGDRIMIRGPSNAGKTQVLNALQGLTDGAVLTEGSPNEYTSVWEYMNQQTREGIPTTGITLRKLLDDETDNEKMMKLSQIAQLGHQFKESSDFDRPLDGLSGGEKMRVGIAFSLWQAEKYRHSIIVMDEPDQGLDESIRIQMLKAVCGYVKDIKKAIVVVFHGSDSDVPHFDCFDKAWVFDPKDGNTTVCERPWSEYRCEMWQNAMNALVRVRV